VSVLPQLDLFVGEVGPRQVARHGRPAACLPYDGMPAYESDTGALAVLENTVVFEGSAAGGSWPLVLPVSYGMAALRSRELTALHDDPDAMWSWRPVLYSLRMTHTQAMGSQGELEYRQGLFEAQLATADLQDRADAFVVEQVLGLRRRYGRIPPLTRSSPGAGFRLPKNARKRMYREYERRVGELNAAPSELPFVAARERADRLLREHLTPQQRLDLAAEKAFHVRGRINRLYRVRLGDGFCAVDPVTRRTVVSFCLHPEAWIPDADVALATKLAIDAGEESEKALLEAARPYPRAGRRPPTRDERRALALERRHVLDR